MMLIDVAEIKMDTIDRMQDLNCSIFKFKVDEAGDAEGHGDSSEELKKVEREAIEDLIKGHFINQR